MPHDARRRGANRLMTKEHKVELVATVAAVIVLAVVVWVLV